MEARTRERKQVAMQVLIVEDDVRLAQALAHILAENGYQTDVVHDGASGLAYAECGDYDVIILDVMLPKMDGFAVVAQLRRKSISVPVLLLTARDKVADRVAGLDSGADDYLTKPFDLDELQARVRALTRRTTGRALPQLVHGELRLDPATHQVTLSGQAVELAPREYALLRLLLENSGKVLSRNQLEQSLYGWSGDVESNAIEVHVHHLRRKLGNQLIRTVRGIGYGIDQPAP